MSDHVKGLVVCGLGVLLISPDTLIIRLVEADQWTLVFWRGLLTGTGLLFIALLAGKLALPLVPPPTGGGLAILLAIGLLSATANVLFVFSVRHTSVTNTLVILASSPFLAALLSRFFLHEHIRKETWLASLITLGGLVIVFSGSLTRGNVVGDLAALGATVALSVNLTLIRWDRAQRVLPGFALGGFLSAVVMLPFAPTLELGRSDAVAVSIGGILLPLALSFLMLGPRYLPAPEVALIKMLETLLGPVWVWSVVGERPHPEGLAAGILLLGTVILHSSLQLKRSRAFA